jgi:serine/threonine protein kinase
VAVRDQLPSSDSSSRPRVEISSTSFERPIRNVGKYRILSELGRGGMANVYLAVARGPGGVNKLVVLKALLPDLATEQGALAMFLDEARLAAQLNHAHVVQTYEVGTEAERHVIVMEYLEGQSFSLIIRRTEQSEQKLSMRMYLRVLINVLEGLHYAHELCSYDGTPLSLVHRDVSPQNVFVTYDGQVKVLDFGIAKAASSSTQTATGLVKGKIAYMAPEQMIAGTIDRRADIYSAGCMAWAMATGQKLWKDMPDVHVMRAVLGGEIPSPQSVNPGVDNELNRIVMKALAPQPDDRYATALEFQADLEAYAESLGPPIKQKDLGTFMSALFADKRSEIRALIERQLALISTEESAISADFSFLPEAANYAQISGTGSHTTGSGSHTTGSGPHLTNSFTGTSPSAESPLPAAPRNNVWILAVIPVLLGVIVLLLWPKAAKTPDVAAPPKVEQTQLGNNPAAPTHATIRLRALPDEATLSLDGEELPSNPADKVLPLDSKSHRARAEARGYEAKIIDFVPTKDETIELSLTARAPEPASSSKRRIVAVRPAARPTPTPTPTPVTSTPAVKKANCEHPFFIDSDGIKKLRKDCL